MGVWGLAPQAHSCVLWTPAASQSARRLGVLPQTPNQRKNSAQFFSTFYLAVPCMRSRSRCP